MWTCGHVFGVFVVNFNHHLFSAFHQDSSSEDEKKKKDKKKKKKKKKVDKL